MSIYISEHALRNHVNDGGVTGGGLESLGARPALARGQGAGGATYDGGGRGRCAQLSSKPAAHSMAYSSLLRSSASSGNSGSFSRFMHVLAVGSRSRSEPPWWMQKAGYSSCKSGVRAGVSGAACSHPHLGPLRRRPHTDTRAQTRDWGPDGDAAAALVFPTLTHNSDFLQGNHSFCYRERTQTAWEILPSHHCSGN